MGTGSPTILSLFSVDSKLFTELSVENWVIRCFKWFSNVLLRLKPNSFDFPPSSLSRYRTTFPLDPIAFAPERNRRKFFVICLVVFLIGKIIFHIEAIFLSANLRNAYRCSMATSNQWCVAVFKCSPALAKKVLVEVYRFTDDLKGVRSLHFLIRDRIDDEVVFSFRVMVEPKFKEIVKSKLSYKLGTLLSKEKYAIDPTAEHNLGQYVAWLPGKRIADFGQSKFNQFIDLLKNMSSIVVQLIESDYFASNERVELSHVVSWMLGCTEYGLLRTSGMEVGYYDRLEDKYSSYLRQDFPKSSDKKKTQTIP